MHLETSRVHSSTRHPLVGRVVTSFGQWRLIDRWLTDDRLLQPHVKWIFVNDKPDDPIPEDMRTRIDKFGQVIQPVINLGRCSARNLGVQALDTEWIDIIDGDDIPLPLEQDFDADAGSCGFIYFGVVNHTYNQIQRDEDCEDKSAFSNLSQLLLKLIGNFDARPIAVLWRRSVFNALGGFDGRSEYVEDLNLVLRALLAGYTYHRTSLCKGSHQRDDIPRLSPPIVSVASIRNWELALLIASEDTVKDVENYLLSWRQSLLRAGMRELEKSRPSLKFKLRETAKWLAGVYVQKLP